MTLDKLPFDPTEDPAPRLRPGCWLIAAGLVPPARHSPAHLLPDAQAAMALSLSTAQLMCRDPAACLGAALAAHLAALAGTLPALAGLALHEILVNAAVHGNLAVASGRAAEWDDLAQREGLLAAALADPVRAGRVVTVALAWAPGDPTVCIVDEGHGHEPGAERAGAPGHRRGAGRGLAIARAAATVTFADAGRCTRLVFARAGAEHA